MKIRIQVIIEDDDGAPLPAADLLTLNRDALTQETLGLTLSEGKALLAKAQESVVAAQCTAFIRGQPVSAPSRSRDLPTILGLDKFGS